MTQSGHWRLRIAAVQAAMLHFAYLQNGGAFAASALITKQQGEYPCYVHR
jgi:hypothetical protein